MTAQVRYKKVFTIGFLIAVFLLALNKVVDTDAWTHFSFGRWIWEHKAVPSSEPFIQTSLPFPYQNWLFGFLYYLAYLIGKMPGVIVFKAVTVTAAFYILLKDALQPFKNHFVAVLTLLIFALLLRYRFVERPDTFLMVFLPFSIFALNAFVLEGRKYLYALPFVHMLWANSHTSIPLMVIPFIAFLAGGLAQHVLQKRGVGFSLTPTPRQLRIILAVFVASFAASLVSPYGLGQYTHSAAAVASDWWRQEIGELLRPVWPLNKFPFIMTPVLLGSFLLNWFLSYRASKAVVAAPSSDTDTQSNAGAAQAVPLIHLLIALPFMMLSFTAIRFIFLLGVVAAPILARNISAAVEFAGLKHYRSYTIFASKAMAAILILCIALFCSLTLLNIGPFAEQRQVFGFGVNYDTVPEKALAYMDRKNITGKVFNLFHWGGYITWRDFPRRRPLIDGRGFLDTDTLEQYTRAKKVGGILDQVQKKYGFSVILIDYPLIPGSVSSFDITLSPSSADWALVYWDDLSLLYVKRGGQYDAVILKDEYRSIDPRQGVQVLETKLHDDHLRKNLLSELVRNAGETASSKAFAFLGHAYNELGLYRQGIDALLHVRDIPPAGHVLQAYNDIAYAYYKLDDLDNSILYLKKAIAVKDDAGAFYRLGTIHLAKGDKKNAARCFREVLERNENILSVYPLLIGLYRESGKEKEAERVAALYRKATVDNEGEEHFKQGMKLYLAGDLAHAEQEFKRSLELNPLTPASYTNLGYIYFDRGDLPASLEFHKKALAIDPNHANAHYGLALVYKKWGDAVNARQHWEEYLKIEPTGFFSRKAKEELQALP